jgi:perosamine synthetase
VPKRDQFHERLAELGVGSNVYYPVPCHRQRPFLQWGDGARLPETDRMTEQILSIPIYPNLTDDEVTTIIGAVNQVADELGEPPPN